MQDNSPPILTRARDYDENENMIALNCYMKQSKIR